MQKLVLILFVFCEKQVQKYIYITTQSVHVTTTMYVGMCVLKKTKMPYSSAKL